jgi:hypothetical protein
MTTQVVKEPSNDNLIEPFSKLYQMGIKNWKNTHTFNTLCVSEDLIFLITNPRDIGKINIQPTLEFTTFGWALGLEG